MKIIEAYKKTQDLLSKTEEIPYNVWTTFYEKKPEKISIVGDQFCLGSDYKTLEEVRESLNWLVTQFGGKIDWDV